MTYKHTNIQTNHDTNGLLSSSFQGVKRLFVLGCYVKDDHEACIKDDKKYFLTIAEIENYNALLEVRNFYDQPINDLIKLYDEVRKVSTGQGDDYNSRRCLLDYAYFKENYRLMEVDLTK